MNKNINIIVVDDNKTMLRIFRSLLAQIGFSNIDEAEDGEIAFAKLKEKKYDLIISDWNMENMTGLELLKKVRETDAIKDLPFLMVTAESKVENVIAAKQAGVSNYIVKPFNVGTLRTKLTSILGSL